jgi:hypothetical protein
MSLHRNSLYILLVSYLLLFVSIVYISEVNIQIYLLSFLIINFIASIFYILVLRKTEDYIYMLLFYFAFFLAYIVKGVVQYFSGIDSFYVNYTLATPVSMEAYLESLYIATQGHFIILITLLLLSFCFNSKPHQKIQAATEKANSLRLVLPLIYIYIFFSSLIMFNYGVAVMGSTEEVELPFKLTGILFYSRTVLLPLLLLYFLQIGIINNDRKFYLRILKTLLFLAVSEIIVRGTKSPLFILCIQLVIMYLLIRISGFKTGFKIKLKYSLLLILTILLLWPLIGLYRILLVENIDFSSLYNMYTNNYIDQSYISHAIESIFQRFLGFLQLTGIVQDSLFNGYSHSIDELLSYDSIARYYTVSYLNLTQEGHLSSPSMLGVALILGGAYWPYVLIVFVIITFSAWRSSKLIKDMSIPIRCFLGYYIFNFIIAGTIDFFIYDAMLVLAFSWIAYVIIQMLNKGLVLR